MPPTIANRNDATSDVFDALSDPLRRHVLTQLNDSDPRNVAEFIASDGGTDTDGDDTSAIRIHHQHLPHLDEAGFVEWNREANVVTRGPRFDEIAPLIDLMANHPEQLPEEWP